MPIVKDNNHEEVIEQINGITIDYATSNGTDRRMIFNFDHGIVQKDECFIDFIYDDIQTCILKFNFKGYELLIV